MTTTLSLLPLLAEANPFGPGIASGTIAPSVSMGVKVMLILYGVPLSACIIATTLIKMSYGARWFWRIPAALIAILLTLLACMWRPVGFNACNDHPFDLVWSLPPLLMNLWLLYSDIANPTCGDPLRSDSLSGKAHCDGGGI